MDNTTTPSESEIRDSVTISPEVIEPLEGQHPQPSEQRPNGEARRSGAELTARDAKVRKAHKSAPGDALGGSQLQFEEIEAWPEQVDGARLFDELTVTFRTYLVLAPGAAEAMALWTIHTHAFAVAEIAPRLAIVSPEKRCGKTTTLRILSKLVRRPLTVANITPAPLFRTIDAARPTLLIDEADTFLGEDKQELKGILNSGHERENARVIRCAGDKFEPRSFSTWAPIAIAKIGKLPDSLQDRSIVIQMHRRLFTDRVQRFTLKEGASLKELARRATRWVQDNLDRLREADPEIPEELHNRAADNWRPLLAIADVVGGEWATRARQTALRLSAIDANDDSSFGTMLLADVRKLFEQGSTDRLSSEDLRERLCKIDYRPWPEYDNGGRISPRQIAALLEPFGIRPGTIRLDDKTPKGYMLKDFSDVFARYLPPAQSATTPQIPARTEFGDPKCPLDAVVVGAFPWHCGGSVAEVQNKEPTRRE